MLTPREIYSEFQNKIINKKSASEVLINLVENSQDENLREESINYIKKIGLKNQSIFEFLENLFISDLNEHIRNAAFNAIKKNFKDKAIKPALYAISKEESFSILIPVIEFLIENFNPLSCKDLLIKKIKNLDNKSLKHDLNLMKLENLNLLRLKNIIYDSLLRNSLENLYFHRRKIPFAVDLDYID
ncbi:MAG: HEAT repeat domain-containing protein [Promethearchaeota archaeon]